MKKPDPGFTGLKKNGLHNSVENKNRNVYLEERVCAASLKLSENWLQITILAPTNSFEVYLSDNISQ